MKSLKLFLVTAITVFGFSCSNKTTNQPEQVSETVGSVLPFPEPPSASTYGQSIFESEHKRRQSVSQLPADAPNIVIVLMDDVGFG